MSYFGLIGYSLVKQTLDGIFSIFDALHIFVSQSPHLRVVLNVPTMKVVAAKFIGPY